MADQREHAHDATIGPGGAGPHDIPQADVDVSPAAERISVAGTLLDASRLLTELLRYVAPEVHRRTERITTLVDETVKALDLAQPWEFEVAARLSQIGCLALPPDTLAAVGRGERLSEDDDRAWASHPLLARDLLADIRRLEAAREMIARQREPSGLPGDPPDRKSADRVAIGAQLLRIAADLDAMVEKGCAPRQALDRLEAVPHEYDEQLLVAVRASLAARGFAEPEPVAA